jgi:hypothetical protein
MDDDKDQEKSHPKTGLFELKASGEFVVMWEGREICRYGTVQAFIDSHMAGLQALDENQADLLETYYRSLR